MFTVKMRRCVLPLMFLFLLTTALVGQTLTSGDIAGTISDPSGGLMPKLTVLLKNRGTGAVQETQTNSQGVYRFSFLSPGSYTLTAEAQNFITVQKIVPVQVGQITTVDIQLAIKTAAASIEVSEAAAGIQTGRQPSLERHSTATWCAAELRQ
jgi:hypothetical protein